MPDDVVAVLGATGTTGRRLTAQLMRQGCPVRPLSRSTTPRFDWSDPAFEEYARRAAAAGAWQA